MELSTFVFLKARVCKADLLKNSDCRVHEFTNLADPSQSRHALGCTRRALRANDNSQIRTNSETSLRVYLNHDGHHVLVDDLYHLNSVYSFPRRH